ncbi:hypothetical protein LCGC14_1424780 [marine sediment metagenome]|uniref:Uncharacterized protein n=1 Tax=marine sediment metagenome TaxID=412755 RepID=A0A0F9MS17_9ZZZZ
MGIISNKKSNKKYSYKLFSEWLKTRRRRLGAVLLLILVISFSFFPFWLWQFESKDISIEQYVEWGGLSFDGVNTPAENIEVRLYEGATLLGTAYTDVSGMAIFFVDSWEANATYNTVIFHNNAEGYPNTVVDLDNDGEYDLITEVGFNSLRINFASLVQWSTAIPIGLATIDIYQDGVYLGDFTTDASGLTEANLMLVYGEYSFLYGGQWSIANITMDKNTTPLSQTYTISIESITIIIYILGILICHNQKTRISVKIFKKQKRFDIANYTVILITNYSKFKI